jgi:hypothetical protein
LDEGQTYVATVYADAPDAHWQLNPEVYSIRSGLVTSKTQLSLKLAPGGGAAVRFKPATNEEKKVLKTF